MNVIRFINQNVPIWSMLAGDHALSKIVHKINPALIDSPSFHSNLDNQLRLDVFKSERQWILKIIGSYPSFSIVRFTHAELMLFDTCFKDISYKEFLRTHVKCMYYEKSSSMLGKPPEYLDKMKRMKISMLRASKLSNVTHNDVDNYTITNNNIWLAANRSILVKRKNGKIMILDGTHRLMCYGLLVDDGANIPKHLYGFYCEE